MGPTGSCICAEKFTEALAQHADDVITFAGLRIMQVGMLDSYYNVSSPQQSLATSIPWSHPGQSIGTQEKPLPAKNRPERPGQNGRTEQPTTDPSVR